VDQLNAARQGQGNNSSANALMVLADYKKDPFNTGKTTRSNFGMRKKRRVSFFLLSP
jgi:hypothetical protein